MGLPKEGLSPPNLTSSQWTLLRCRISKGLYRRLIATNQLKMSKGEIEHWFVNVWNQTYSNLAHHYAAIAEPASLTDLMMDAAQAVNREMKVRFPMLHISGYDLYAACSSSKDGKVCRLYIDVAPKGVTVTDCPLNWTLH